MTRAHTLLGFATLAAICVVPATGFGGPQDASEIRAAVVARSLQPGEVVRLDVTCECAGTTPRASVFGADVRLFPAGGSLWQGLIGIDLDRQPGAYPLTVSVDGPTTGRRERVVDLRVAAKAFPTRRLRVAPNFVDPPPAEVERLLREAKVLDALFQASTPRLWDGAFLPPMTSRTTGVFGSRSVFNGQPRSPHGGVDFAGATGTPVASPGAGRVVLAEDLYFTGNTVVIDHGLGLVSLLAHLSAMSVTAGDVVERGANVGRVGATGRVTGPHLHWTVRLAGARVDPLSLLVATAPGTPAVAQRSVSVVFLASAS